MISAGDFRNGITLEIDGNVYQIMEFQHVKPGKGAAFVRTKIKERYQRRRCRENLPSDREVPGCKNRPCRYAVSVRRWRPVQLHERRELRADRFKQG